MYPISSYPRYHSVQQPVAHQQPIRFQHQQQHPYPVVQQQYQNNVGYQQQHYPQNMIYATNPVNHATLTLPHNSSISINPQNNGTNMVDVAIPPFSHAYEQQPNVIPPHMAYQFPMYAPQVQYHQPAAIQQQPVAPKPKPVQPSREKKILSLINPSTNRRACLHPSIQRKQLSTLKRDPNAWKPDVMNVGNTIDRIAKVRKDVRGLLNKITPTTYNDLSVEMINKCFWQDEETLPIVVELIFNKAVEEPTFVELYSDLCHSLHKAEENMKGPVFKGHFQCALLRKCRSSFDALSEYPECILKLQEQIKEEESKVDGKDEKKNATAKKDIEEMSVKEKRRMLSTINFVSELIKSGLLDGDTIDYCLHILISNAEHSDLMTEYAVVMVKCVGPYLVEKEKFILDVCVDFFVKLKGTVSNRVKFMIMDLMELRDRKWVQQQK